MDTAPGPHLAEAGEASGEPRARHTGRFAEEYGREAWEGDGHYNIIIVFRCSYVVSSCFNHSYLVITFIGAPVWPEHFWSAQYLIEGGHPNDLGNLHVAMIILWLSRCSPILLPMYFLANPIKSY